MKGMDIQFFLAGTLKLVVSLRPINPVTMYTIMLEKAVRFDKSINLKQFWPLNFEIGKS
jgi:hypothetical protein